MGGSWENFRQWWYPAPFRIHGSSPEIGRLCLELDALREQLAVSAEGGGSAREQPGAGAGLDKDFIVTLCNNLFRLDRSVQRAAKQGSEEAERLQDHLARLRRNLQEKGVTYEDLSGQQYHSGRADFEPLGSPMASPGLNWPTILKCERPVVLRNGEVLQCAKGVVGTPA